MLMTDCNSLPRRYAPLSSVSEITEKVCIVTHSPPKESIPEHRMKRRYGSSICGRPRQPLESSMMPMMPVRNGRGDRHKIHRSKYVIHILKQVTQAQICATALVADHTACVSEIFPGGETCDVPLSSADKNWAVHKTDNNWIAHKAHGTHGRGKAEPIMPNRNAGPHWLQSGSILSACDLVNCPAA